MHNMFSMYRGTEYPMIRTPSTPTEWIYIYRPEERKSGGEVEVKVHSSVVVVTGSSGIRYH